MPASRATARDLFPLVEQHLRSAGLQTLDRCQQTGPDLRVVIAADRGVLVACLVQARARRSRSPAANTISRTRTRALRRLAMAWLDAHGVRFDQIRIDIVGLVYEGTGGYTIEHLRGVG